MKRDSALILLAAVAAVVANCSEDEVKPEQFAYPLTVGSRWFYSHTLIQVSHDNNEVVVVQEGSASVTVGGVETLENIGVAYRLDVERTDNGETWNGAEYYQNRDDGLHRVARCSQPGAVSPKVAGSSDEAKERYLLMSALDVVPTQACDGPPEIETDEPLVMPYPTRIGYDWVFRDLPDAAVTIHKTILGWGKVTVPAGKMDSYRIKWTYVGNSDVEVEDYIAECGLIKRSAISKNVDVTDYRHPSNPPIIADLHDELVLDSVVLTHGPEQFTYPLAVGNTWHYTRSVYTGPDIDSVELDFEEPVTVSVGAIEVLEPVGEAVRFDVEVGEGSLTVRGEQYYQNRDDGLYSVAGCAAGAVVTPKLLHGTGADARVEGALPCLDLASPQDCTGGSFFVEVDPPLVLSYPEQVGKEWHYRTVEEIGVTIRKRITGWNRVTVPAGEFDAFRVEWIYVTGPPVTIVDNISAFGLVSRTIQVDSIRVTTPNFPDSTTGYETWLETLTLDSLKR